MLDRLIAERSSALLRSRLDLRLPQSPVREGSVDHNGGPSRREVLR